MFRGWPRDPKNQCTMSDTKLEFCGLQVTTTTVLGTFELFLLSELLSMFISAFTFPYVLNTWLEFFGKDPMVLWWHGAILGIFAKYAACMIPAAMGTWIIMLFLL